MGLCANALVLMVTCDMCCLFVFRFMFACLGAAGLTGVVFAGMGTIAW